MACANGAKKNEETALGRQAEQGGQAINVDLCFVPWAHAAEGWLPAVSGSSGHLVVEHRAAGEPTRDWPGQVFQQLDRSYEEAMQAYIQRTRDRLFKKKQSPRLPELAPPRWQKEMEARTRRHQLLQQRRQEDADWRADRQAHKRIVAAYVALSRKARTQQSNLWQSQTTYWSQRQQARQALLVQRKIENQRWHQDKQAREHTAAAVWIAILVVTDNATRQCLGLPVFATGAHVTTTEVTQALRLLLPAGLSFLISDQGKHFISTTMAQLAREANFIHVPIYRHRPQTNGIAERFVRTLKQALRHSTWSSPEQLLDRLQKIRPAYNDRPHQGLPIPGLSPNEFAHRIWLM